MMTPERLAEWRKFALEAIPQLSRLSDKSESERVIISACATVIVELTDVLATERERAEKLRGITVNLLYILKEHDHQDESWPEWQQRIEELEK